MCTKGKVMPAMEIKTAAALGIKQLYHYQSFEPERLKCIFTDEMLYFSIPRDFNDPWDCQPCFSKSGLDDAEEYKRAVSFFAECDRTQNISLSEAEHDQRKQKMLADRKFLESMIDQMTSGMKEAIHSQFRVYCLSTHPDSILMWAHYAASCRGLCLEFSVQDELFCCALPVEYLDNYPLFSIADTGEQENIRPLITKSRVWNYEDEYRIIASEHPFKVPTGPSAKFGFVKFQGRALKSIIFGSQMSESDQDMIRAMVNDSGWNVDLKVATLVPDRYEFKIT